MSESSAIRQVAMAALADPFPRHYDAELWEIASCELVARRTVSSRFRGRAVACQMFREWTGRRASEVCARGDFTIAGDEICDVHVYQINWNTYGAAHLLRRGGRDE